MCVLGALEELDLVSYNIDISNFSYYQLTVMCQQYIYCKFNVIVTMIGKPELQLHVYTSKAFDLAFVM